ncbi:MAG TPA: hypothetical protein PKL44_03095 [Candidatus Dojkabacteria bacterium]|nr:hypothetical protein [Candidatus Dojkabacteria bacterium]
MKNIKELADRIAVFAFFKLKEENISKEDREMERSYIISILIEPIIDYLIFTYIRLFLSIKRDILLLIS